MSRGTGGEGLGVKRRVSRSQERPVSAGSRRGSRLEWCGDVREKRLGSWTMFLEEWFLVVHSQCTMGQSAEQQRRTADEGALREPRRN